MQYKSITRTVGALATVASALLLPSVLRHQARHRGDAGSGRAAA
jgi:hypothetical protein